MVRRCVGMLLVAVAALAGASRESIASTCSPDSVFGAPQLYPTGSAPMGVATADLDGNGTTDVVVANSSIGYQGTVNAGLSVLLGNGGGQFTVLPRVDIAGAPVSVVVADFNGDGIPDVATANYFGNTVAVLMGNGTGGRGDGTFAPPVYYAVGAGPYFIVTADLNHDGIADLVTANKLTNRVSVLLGSGAGGVGDGTFAAATSYAFGATGSSAWSCAIGDFNGDGNPDLAVAVYNTGSVAVLPGNGLGGFGAATQWTGLTNPRMVVARDVNGDGILDLVVSEAKTIGVLLGGGAGGAGNGTFGAPVHDAVDNEVNTIVVDDFDGDGILDVVAADGLDDRVDFLRGGGTGGVGNGQFALAAIARPTDLDPAALASADFDADGRRDLVAATLASDDATVLLNPCRSTPPEVPSWIAWAANGVPVCRAPGLQTSPVLVADGGGGAFVAWVDVRGADDDIYFSHLGPDGSVVAGWPTDGAPVCTASGNQYAVTMVPDDLGGVFLAWSDDRTTAPAVYFQHMGPAGAPAPGWPANGVPVPAPSYQYDPGLARDGTGGMLLYWRDVRNNAGSEPFLLRINSAGAAASGWPAGGLQLDLNPIENVGAIVEDGHGGAWVTWGSNLGSGSYWVQSNTVEHVAGDGSSLEGSTESSTGADAAPTLALDPVGGVAVARGVPVQIVVQHLGWSVFGEVWVSDQPYRPFAIAPDRTGGVYATTQEDGPSGIVLQAKHVIWPGDLAPGWVFGPGPVLDGSERVVMTADSTGGVFCAWQDLRSGHAELYATRVRKDASPSSGWSLGGTAIAAAGPASYQDMIGDGSGGALLAWKDQRADAGDIYAQRIVTGDFATPTLADLVSAEADPGHVRLVWYATGRAGTTARVERRDAGTDWTTLATIGAGGDGRLAYEDDAVVPGTRYAYRLAILDGGSVVTTPERWIQVPQAFAFALGGLRPNPCGREGSVEYSLATAEPARLEWFDISGRRVSTTRLEPAPGLHVVTLPGLGAFAPGLYVLRLTQGARSLTARACIVR